MKGTIRLGTRTERDHLSLPHFRLGLAYRQSDYASIGLRLQYRILDT
jgi:hypothetical protein